VLVDVEPDFLTIDPASFAAAITSRSKAVIVVHIHGRPAAMDRLMPIARQAGLIVIEDCAQAHGATIARRRVGSIGDVGCFSFYPTKNLGAIGDGGMLVTSDDSIAAQARSLREYGWSARYVSAVPGWNTRLDELQAAILRVKLPALDADNDRRRAIAGRYDNGLRGLALSVPPRRSETSPAFHHYVVRSCSRDALLAHLLADEIGALIHYPAPVHSQPAYAARRLQRGSMMETERAAAEILSLPMFPELTQADQDAVIRSVRSFFGATS